MFELTEMEAYAAQLERVAEHGNEGTLGALWTPIRGTTGYAEREDGYIDAALQESDRAERATERNDAARQLAEILAAHNTPADIE